MPLNTEVKKVKKPAPKVSAKSAPAAKPGKTTKAAKPQAKHQTPAPKAKPLKAAPKVKGLFKPSVSLPTSLAETDVNNVDHSAPAVIAPVAATTPVKAMDVHDLFGRVTANAVKETSMPWLPKSDEELRAAKTKKAAEPVEQSAPGTIAFSSLFGRK